MESVDSGERNGERERRRRPETIGARALCTTVSEYLWLLPDSSGTPSASAHVLQIGSDIACLNSESDSAHPHVTPAPSSLPAMLSLT